jgi:predicted DCC family thiol-disulfide oxidoreductase YuxK
LANHGLSGDSARSIILLEDNHAYLRSTASLRIASRLSPPWSLARVFLLVPVPIRDAVYRVVAAIRHRIAGRSNACDVPPPAIRARMI